MNPDELFGDLPVLETERLVLRKLTSRDIGAVYEYGREPEVARYMPWEYHRSIDDAAMFVRSQIDNYRRGQPASWGIVLKDEDRLIGASGFGSWSLSNSRAEMGYVLAKSHWNQGLMTEVASELIRFGFEQMHLNRLQARAVVENIASWRIMEKVGMTYEGTERQARFEKGRFVDFRVYAILREQYFAQFKLPEQ